MKNKIVLLSSLIMSTIVANDKDSHIVNHNSKFIVTNSGTKYGLPFIENKDGVKHFYPQNYSQWKKLILNLQNNECPMYHEFSEFQKDKNLSSVISSINDVIMYHQISAEMPTSYNTYWNNKTQCAYSDALTALSKIQDRENRANAKDAMSLIKDKVKNPNISVFAALLSKPLKECNDFIN